MSRRLLVALLAVLLVVQGARALADADDAVYGGAGADYVAFATGGRLVAAGDRCLYCLDHQATAQAELLGGRPPGATGFPHTFANAPLAAALIAPLASRSLADGLRLFELALLLAFAAAILLTARLASRQGIPAVLVAAVAVTTVPADQALLLAQWDPLLLLALAGAALLLRAGRPSLAGLCASVLLVKPQSALLLLPALLLSGAAGRRAAAGLAAGGVAWWGSGLLVAGGAHFPADLVHLLAGGQAGEGTTTAGLPALAGWTPSGNAAVLPAGALCVALGLAVLVAVRGRLGDPVTALLAGVLLSLLAAPHIFSDDLLLVAPAIAVVAARTRPPAALVLAALLDLAWVVDERVIAPGPRLFECAVVVLTTVLLLRDRAAGGRGVGWKAMRLHSSSTPS